MQQYSLSGKVAVVTGGNGGIGLSIARGLAGNGAAVVIVNRRDAEGQKAAESLKKEGLKATAVPADVASTASLNQMVTKVIHDFGHIDILVNSAGVIRRKPAEDISEEDWDFMMDINLKGAFFCCQAVGREMIRSKKGKIINISSIVSNRMNPLRSAYAISKAGINHLTRALAFEWGRYNISVNAIAPTATITDLSRKFFVEEHPEALEAIVKSTPMGRIAAPEDYVGTAIYLASDASNYVTGQILYVDGGATL